MTATPVPAGGVLAVYRHVDAASDAIRQVKAAGYADLTVYTPVPNHEIARAVGHPTSPVRVWALLGGLFGCFTGFAITFWMSYDYPLAVGGKPLGSIPPYVVIAFELTILFGAMATIAGLLFHAWKDFRNLPYDPRCSDDHIGVFVACPAERRPSVEQVLRTAGAVEVRGA